VAVAASLQAVRQLRDAGLKLTLIRRKLHYKVRPTLKQIADAFHLLVVAQRCPLQRNDPFV
jgi:hypothetical protein